MGAMQPPPGENEFAAVVAKVTNSPMRSAARPGVMGPAGAATAPFGLPASAARALVPATSAPVPATSAPVPATSAPVPATSAPVPATPTADSAARLAAAPSLEAPAGTQLWTEKYRPRTRKDLIGNPGIADRIFSWLETWCATLFFWF